MSNQLFHWLVLVLLVAVVGAVVSASRLAQRGKGYFWRAFTRAWQGLALTWVVYSTIAIFVFEFLSNQLPTDQPLSRIAALALTVLAMTAPDALQRTVMETAGLEAYKALHTRMLRSRAISVTSNLFEGFTTARQSDNIDLQTMAGLKRLGVERTIEAVERRIRQMFQKRLLSTFRADAVLTA